MEHALWFNHRGRLVRMLSQVSDRQVFSGCAGQGAHLFSPLCEDENSAKQTYPFFCM